MKTHSYIHEESLLSLVLPEFKQTVEDYINSLFLDWKTKDKIRIQVAAPILPFSYEHTQQSSKSSMNSDNSLQQPHSHPLIKANIGLYVFALLVVFFLSVILLTKFVIGRSIRRDKNKRKRE